MISKDEILMGREGEYPLSLDQQKNLDRLLVAVNIVRAAYGKPLHVTSGYRPGKYNVAAGGAKASCHLTCEAVDFEDRSRDFTKWCISHLEILEKAGLWMESPLDTATWVHLQTRPVKNRVFRA